MTDVVFTADPTRLIISAGVGIVLLLFLIIKFKLHPVISMMISAIVIGIGAGMPLNLIAETVQKGVGKTLQGIALLIGLGSMFGGILEVSGGAQKMAQTLISKFGQKKPCFRAYRSCNWYNSFLRGRSCNTYSSCF